MKNNFKSSCRQINIKHVNDAQYRRRSVGCLILTHDRQLLLQLRDADAPTFPNYISTFGGGIEDDETPMQALIRELHEELGATVNPGNTTTLGAVTEPESQHQDLVYLYFWHDAKDSIQGCFEGEAKCIRSITDLKAYPKVMNDVIWAINESKKNGLL